MPGSSNSSLFPWVGGMILGSAATASLIYGIHLAKNRGGPDSFLARNKNKKKTIASTYQATHGEQLSGTFLTDLLAALWKHIAEAGAIKLRSTMEPMFPDMLPGPLRSLHFTKVSLGDVPLQLDNIVVHDLQTHNDADDDDGVEFVEYEMDVVWDGRMDVQMRADYIGAFGVRSVKLRGRLSVILQPLTGQVLPCFRCASYAFISRPELDMDFTGLAQAADFSGLRAAIRDMMLDVLAGMMVLPNRQLYKMDDTVSYLDTHVPPLGVARLTLWRGRGFRVEKRNLLRGDDVPDCYCNIQLSNSAVWKTSVIRDSVAPVWGKDEQCDFLLFHHDQVVQVQAWDEDTGLGDADDSLGRAEVSVGELLLAPGGSKEVELLEPNGKATGAFVTLHCAVQPLVTDLKTTSLLVHQMAASETTSTRKNDKLMLGLLTILVSQAFDVPIRDAKSSYFVHMQCGEAAEFVTAAVTGESHPLYECTFRLPITASMLLRTAGSGDATTHSCHHSILRSWKAPWSTARRIAAWAPLRFPARCFGILPTRPSRGAESLGTPRTPRRWSTVFRCAVFPVATDHPAVVVLARGRVSWLPWQKRCLRRCRAAPAATQRRQRRKQWCASPRSRVGAFRRKREACCIGRTYPMSTAKSSLVRARPFGELPPSKTASAPSGTNRRRIPCASTDRHSKWRSLTKTKGSTIRMII